MKIVFFGTPQFAVPSLESLLKHPAFEVVAVVTQPDKPRGRGKKLIPSAVKKVAVEHEIPVWQPRRVKKDGETLAKLAETGADAFAVVAYGQILSSEILAMPKLGCINGHGSVLPQYRGAAPIQWCLVQGETETGMTTMLMDEGMDTGDMLLKSFTPIDLLDNAHQLAAKLAEMGADLLVKTLLKLEQEEVKPIPQDDSQATYARLIQKSDYVLDWSNSALDLHNQIRGFFPNCFTMWRDQKLKVMATLPLGEAFWSKIPSEYQQLEEQWDTWCSLSGEPGEVVAIAKKFGPIISTGSGLLLLREVQLAGKRPQSGWDFCNGMRLSLGEVLSNE